jgi:hypothetical protein
MKKLITIAAATLVMSSTAFAQTVVHNHSKFETASFATQDAAINAGHDVADSLASLSSFELSKKLNTHGDDIKHVKVNDVEVAVQPFSASRGQIAYRAVVEVKYQYQADLD